MTYSAYPNEGSNGYTRQNLWFSMFTRNMKNEDFMEIEIEIEK